MIYDVLVTQKDTKFIAHVRQWPAVNAEGETEEEALRKIQMDLKSLLSKGRVVQLEIDEASEEHPWKQFAGMFADDPDWNAFQAAIQQYREERDESCGED